MSDYFEILGIPARFDVSAEELEARYHARSKVLHPDRLVWVVVGDRAKIEAGVRELKLGEVRFLDADANPVK